MVFFRICARSFLRSILPTRFFVFISALYLSIPAMASEIVTLNIASEALDLDSGSVSQTLLGNPNATNGIDVQMAYNADRSPHAVVSPAAEGVELAFVAGVGFDGVTSSDIPSLNFSTEASDLPFSANDCVVVRTDQGTYFKLGNATETGLSITFNYEAL